MARSSRSPARLIVALSVAAVLAVFLIYTAIAGSTPALEPSNLAGHLGVVSLTGKVTGRVTGDAHASIGLHFKLRNISGKSPTVPVVYHGSRPGGTSTSPERSPAAPSSRRRSRRSARASTPRRSRAAWLTSAGLR